jgi:isoleucyl-tRNA synthetase
LARYLNVAKVKIIDTDNDKIVAKVSDAKFIKCERCWNYYEPEKMYDEHICTRCHKVLVEN